VSGLPVPAPGPRAAVALLTAGALPALILPGARLGLGLALSLVAIVAAAAALAGHRPRGAGLAFAALGLALVAQAVLRDDAFLVVVDALGAGWAATLALGGAARWPALVGAAVGLWRHLLRGLGLATVTLRGVAPAHRGEGIGPVARGAVLSAVLAFAFGGLFASADTAFAELAGGAFTPDVEADDVLLRVVLMLGALALVGSLAIAAMPRRPQASTAGAVTRRGLERVEWVMPLAALVLLFAAFVAVQVTVLFGGQRHVLATAGLGYGEYARKGFGQLVCVAALTLAVIAGALRLARRSAARDELLLRGLLGALCALTGVVLASALHRLGLVEDAYGFTRVRLAGHAVALALAALFALVALAGVWRPAARHLPRLAVALILGDLVAYSTSAPDARIARENVERFARTGQLDRDYVQRLSAEAVPALVRLPEKERRCVLAEQRRRLRTSDGGWAAANHARSRARAALARAPSTGTDRACLPRDVGW